MPPARIVYRIPSRPAALSIFSGPQIKYRRQQADLGIQIADANLQQVELETVNAVTMWLDGHLTDEEDPAVVDFDKMKHKAERLAAYCGQNPEMSLMTAAENIMSK